MILFYIILLSIILILGVFLVQPRSSSKREGKKRSKVLNLKRFQKNPIMSPRMTQDWEIQGVFNPAAVKIGDTTYLLYRAVGRDGVSKIGYCLSEDGETIREQGSYPIFALNTPRLDTPNPNYHFDPILYPSGGSWGGCEDPRAVELEGRIYMTFNAFDGWDFLRIGVTSIDKKDFISRRWNWAKPIFISPPGEIHKNWVIFPEKINGKFAVLHSVNPEVQIEFVDNLNLLSKEVKIKSQFGQKAPRKEWDTWVRGAGAPPIKTRHGWLLFYHATNIQDPHKYKLGAMLLDLKDPKKVLHRSPSALLEPDEWYENDWKPGVVYVCGAVINGNQVFVYYGGGDKHTCLATAHLDELINFIKGRGTGSKIFEKVK
jgi:predicted GH43/DUF377 family glycosyl hydrolase